MRNNSEQRHAVPAVPGAHALQGAIQHVGQGINTWRHASSWSLQQAGQQLQTWTSGLQQGLAAWQLGVAYCLPGMQHADIQLIHQRPPANCRAASKPAPCRRRGDDRSDSGSMALPLASLTSQLSSAVGQPFPAVEPSAARKAELGRATWTLLHMLAAQYPDQPTRQQKRDVTQLINSLTRVYPCATCSSHFEKIVKRDPPTVGSGPELQAWTCRVHNIVNRSLGKPEFNCDVVGARWAPLDCGTDGDGRGQATGGCDMTVGRRRK